MRVQDDPRYLFSLRVALYRRDFDKRQIVVHAYEGDFMSTGSHIKVEVEVRHGGEVIFPRGSLWCGIPAGHSIDGTYAKEAVLSLVAMKPGDTDAEYFESYTERQIEWVERYGEDLGCEREARYCDENGAVRE